MKGKTAIITGANSGLGLETAFILAKRQYRLILACKNDGEVVRNQIIKTTNNSNILTKELNLSCLKSVREFSDTILQSQEKIDLLINNAGIYSSREENTKDGINTTMQINYFGPFLLTYLLSELLRKSAPSRIVFVASSLAFINNLSSNNIQKSAGCDVITYGNSKLCCIIASKCFAQRLKSDNVTSNSLHPGMIHTKFLVSSNYLQDLQHKCLRLVTKDIAYGAKNVAHLATDKHLDNTTGQFFINMRRSQPPCIVNDEMFINEVFEESCDIVNIPKVNRILK